MNNLVKNIKNFELKMKDMENFQEKIDSFSNKFEELIEKDFNITLNKIDDLIISAKNLREYYVKTYKEKIARYIQTLSFLKIFYLNFYKDRDLYMTIIQPEKYNIYNLIYLNSISYELLSMDITHSLAFENDITKIKKLVDSLWTKERGLVTAKFNFRKIKKDFKMFDSFQAHQKFIGGLILTHNNNRIMTSSKDCILKVWDHREDKKKVQEEASKKIISLFGLKNGKILASRDKDILIYELNEKKKYFNSQSLSSHKELVFALGELEDGTIISGGKDKKIILWEEAPDRKQYQVKQEILTNKEIQMLTVLSDFKIAFSGFNDSCINILGTKTILEKKEKKIEEKIESTSYEQICELNKHRGIVTCLCKLNFGYMASGGGDSKKYIDHNIYIWKPTNTGFDIGQVINDAHLANVNCLILLRDGRMASSSTDRTIKIWGINKFKIKSNNKVEFVLQQVLKEYKHGLYKMIQLEDDSIVASSSDNFLVFWNHPNIF
jgi:WD40 repeat protein